VCTMPKDLKQRTSALQSPSSAQIHLTKGSMQKR
jgi:hypothetical protein